MAWVEGYLQKQKRRNMNKSTVDWKGRFDCNRAWTFLDQDSVGDEVLTIAFDASADPDQGIQLCLPPKTALTVAALVCQFAATGKEVSADI